MTKHPGITVRHARSCRGEDACNCSPTYQAWVWSKRDDKKIKKSFPALAAAKTWRANALTDLSRGTLKAPTQQTLRDAAELWLAGARDGSIRTRSGDPYKPSAIRGYDGALRLYVLDDLGGCRLSEVQRADVQDLADRLLGRGLDASTVRNALMPLRAIYRRAINRNVVAVNPTMGLELPAVTGKRERIASPDEAAKLIGAVAELDQALWATAFYAGLRRGELMELRWEDIDLHAGVIRVTRAWDPVARLVIETKNRRRRNVPIPAVLRSRLMQHRLRSGRSAGLVFSSDGRRRFDDSCLIARAKTAWTKSTLAAIGLHEARHTYASLMIAAGVNAKALATYMGHSSITITYDRYGHLMPGNEDEAAGLLDAYLASGAGHPGVEALA